MKYMQGRKKLDILELLGHGTMAFGDVLDAIVSGHGKGSVRKKTDRLMRRADDRHAAVRSMAEDRAEKARLRVIVSRLQKNGLVEKSDGGSIAITKRGRQCLIDLQKGVMPPRRYSMRKSSRAVVVIFDIPERDRRKRGWIVAALRGMGFALVQKSVWMGAGKLPADFIADLGKMQLMRHVRIFSVVETGTIADRGVE